MNLQLLPTHTQLMAGIQLQVDLFIEDHKYRIYAVFTYMVTMFHLKSEDFVMTTRHQLSSNRSHLPQLVISLHLVLMKNMRSMLLILVVRYTK